MSLSKRFGRSILVVIAILMTWSSPAVQAAGGYRFESTEGNITLSDVRVATWDDDSGDYTVKITITPTADEIDALLSEGTHVDLEVSFLGLEESGKRTDFAASESHYVRHVGDEIVSESGDPVVRVLGFNLERWESGDEVIITAAVYGYEPSRGAFSKVAVDLVSSTWWLADGNCTIVHERERGGEVDQFCAEWSTRSSLFDWDGDTRFPIQ